MISRAELIASSEAIPDRMLAPSAYSESLLPSLRLTRSSRYIRRIGRVVLLLLVAGFLLVSVAPWQQSVTASGNVVAFAPRERQQTLEVPIKGRVVRWGNNVFENARVRKGELIAEIRDIDSNLVARLGEQLAASEAQLKSLELLLRASERSRDASETVVSTLKLQLQGYESVKEQIVASAEAAIASAENKVNAELRQLDEHKAALTQIEADYLRQKKLFEENIVAEVKFQLAERKYLETLAKVKKATEYVESARNELLQKQRDRDAKMHKSQIDIDYAKALLQKAMADYAKAESEVAKAESEYNKSRKSFSEMQTKVARQQSLVVAPFDGFLTKITPNQGSQIMKEGDPLCVIVPDTSDRAVQVWLNGNDAPLVENGRHVRLQFEGWPAVQFAGWPSVAVGTFGGKIVSVDATDNGKGKFRALVRPDGANWPDERYLRQGVRANAWVLLERVPLWYEIWRNMNGFPPVVTQDEEESKDSKNKKPKLPK